MQQSPEGAVTLGPGMLYRSLKELMGERLYSVLLRVYPNAFRDLFGPWLLELYCCRREQARARGRAFWRIRFWWFITWDLVRSAWAERLGRDSFLIAGSLGRGSW